MMIYATVSVWGDDKGKKKRNGRTVVGETVADVSELALLNVLLDRVESLLLGDLHLGIGPSGNLNDHYRLKAKKMSTIYLQVEKKKKRDVLLRIVLDSSAKRGMSLVIQNQPHWTWLVHRRREKENNVLEGRDDLAFLLDVDTVLYVGKKVSINNQSVDLRVLLGMMFRWVKVPEGS